MEARLLMVHFGSTIKFRVKFYPQGARDELLAGIREILGLAPATPLRFQDLDGDVVLISPLGMPSGTELHCAIEQGPPFQGIVAPSRLPSSRLGDAALETSGMPCIGPPSSLEWRRWDRAESGSITEDGLKYDSKGGLGQHPASVRWSVFTPTLPSTGTHYFVIRLSDLPCCVSIGLVPASVQSFTQSLLVGSMDYPFMVALNRIGKGPPPTVNDGMEQTTDTAKEMAVGVYFNMDERMLVLVPHDDLTNPERAIRMDDIPIPAVFAMVAPKHHLAATIEHCDTPSEVFCGREAIFKKVPSMFGRYNM
eukprot:gene8510-4870_t